MLTNGTEKCNGCSHLDQGYRKHLNLINVHELGIGLERGEKVRNVDGRVIAVKKDLRSGLSMLHSGCWEDN